MALVLAMLGAVVLINPLSSSGDYSLLGMVSAFLAGWALAIWVLWAKKIERIRGVTASTCVAGYSLFTVGFLLIVYLVEGEFISEDGSVESIPKYGWIADSRY